MRQFSKCKPLRRPLPIGGILFLFAMAAVGKRSFCEQHPMTFVAQTNAPQDGQQAHPAVTIHWEARTRRLIQAGGGYGRMIHLAHGGLLCAYEQAGQVWVRRSRDNGKTWQPAVLVAACATGTAANPELLQLHNGWLLLPYNERPRDGKSPFTICLCISKDEGKTWATQSLLYTADADPHNGCWEPAALQLPSGEIQLFFANENPYRQSDEQEITLLRSLDNGLTWSKPQPVAFRCGHRDGMPVPLLLNDNSGIVFALEDNGLPTNKLQPAVIFTSLRDNWKQEAAGGDSPRRWWAVEPALPNNAYAGAPYLRQLSGGETLLSCQSDAGGRRRPQMVVYVGDPHARHFTSPTFPFGLAPTEGAYWNSLCVKDHAEVTALASTTIEGVRGLWAIDGHVVRAPQTQERERN